MKPTWIRDVIDYLANWMSEPAARVAVALALVVLGLGVAWVLGKLTGWLLQRLTTQLLRFVGSSPERAETESVGLVGGEPKHPSTQIVERVVFWFVFVFFLAGATSLLGFPIVSTWLRSLAGYLPRVLAAVVVLLLGVLSARLIRVVVHATLRRARFVQAEAFARVVYVLVILVAAVVAVDELGVQVTFVIVIATTVMAVLLGGVALAFGLGARETVSNLVAAHYLSRTYRVGQRVRIGEHEGRIAEIQSTTVLLDTEEGQTHLPARLFHDTACVVLKEAEE